MNSGSCSSGWSGSATTPAGCPFPRVNGRRSFANWARPSAGYSARFSPFLGELAGARAQKGRFVHLRLSLSAFELALLPFEAAVAPNGFPGSGSPLFLQSKIPITLDPGNPSRPTPAGGMGSPAPHSLYFRFAPWFCPGSRQGASHGPAPRHRPVGENQGHGGGAIGSEVKKILTVLPDATLEQVRQASMDTEYSHVHILAHGAPYDHAGDRRYGLALCSGKNPGEADVIDGEALAIALNRKPRFRHRGPSPTHGPLPCHLRFRKCTLRPHPRRQLGPRASRGRHPLGLRLPVPPLDGGLPISSPKCFTSDCSGGPTPAACSTNCGSACAPPCPDTHDWASIVAYATVPWDFEKQVDDFRDRQTRERIETLFARLDHLLATGKDRGPGWEKGFGGNGSSLRPHPRGTSILAGRTRRTILPDGTGRASGHERRQRKADRNRL